VADATEPKHEVGRHPAPTLSIKIANIRGGRGTMKQHMKAKTTRKHRKHEEESASSVEEEGEDEAADTPESSGGLDKMLVEYQQMVRVLKASEATSKNYFLDFITEFEDYNVREANNYMFNMMAKADSDILKGLASLDNASAKKNVDYLSLLVARVVYKEAVAAFVEMKTASDLAMKLMKLLA
jgi:hypothetical protein